MPTPSATASLSYMSCVTTAWCMRSIQTGSIVYGPVRRAVGHLCASPILADGKIYVTTEEKD